MEFSPWSLSFIQTMAKASEPMPLAVGSTTVRQAAVAMAASTALPPFFSTSSPAAVARLLPLHTMPLRAVTQ